MTHPLIYNVCHTHYICHTHSKITATGLEGTRGATFRTTKRDKRALIGMEGPKQEEPKQLQTTVANEQTLSDTVSGWGVVIEWADY